MSGVDASAASWAASTIAAAEAYAQAEADAAADARWAQREAEAQAQANPDGVDNRTFDQKLDDILSGVERPRFDARTEARLAELHPDVRDKAIEHLQLLEILGEEPRIGGRDGGLRTYERQDELYAQGRTEPGQIVTNAQGGESFHNFGAAYDVTMYRDGQPIQRGDDPAYQTSGIMGEAAGMEWGGRWNHPDMPHFQQTDGQTPAEMRQRYENGQDIYTGE